MYCWRVPGWLGVAWTARRAAEVRRGSSGKASAISPRTRSQHLDTHDGSDMGVEKCDGARARLVAAGRCDGRGRGA
ncbi:hypothetical protein OBBRIDRAFT_792729 [Obba rivulosa]|uniref:Uncharacterized protein n=1 Tax=Obba rivulosa TaxID=1052685 RepID=A0A8E2AZM8_9APHY|nr:hypothetical protein OBBRIDRAFT_792729 [Obba rivulosa]